MKNRENIEEVLDQLSIKPSPPGLRERVLCAVHQEKKNRVLISPSLKILRVLCIFLIGFSLLFDWQVSRHQGRKMDSLLPVAPILPNAQEKEGETFIAELGNEYARYLNLAARKKEATPPMPFPYWVMEEFHED